MQIKIKRNLGSGYKVEFHIAKDLRKKYEFEHELFSYNGNVIFARQAVHFFIIPYQNYPFKQH